MKTIRANALHKQWMKDPKYRAEYEALEEEFSRIAATATKSERTRLREPHPVIFHQVTRRPKKIAR